MKRLTAIILALALSLSTTHAQQWRFVNFGSDEGMSSNMVLAITQDSDGMMWLGTRNGLNRFDGAHFTVWKQGDIPSGHVTSLAVDTAGKLWVGTAAGLCVRVGETFERFPAPSPGNHVRALYADADGTVWAAYKDSVVVRLSYGGNGFEEKGRARYNIGDFEGDYPFQQIFEDSRGRIWLAGRMVNCQVMEDKSSMEFRNVDTSYGVFGNYALTPDSHGIIGYNDWIGSIQVKGDDESVFRDLGRLPIDHVTLLRDREGRLWAAGSYGIGVVDEENVAATKVITHDAENPFSPSSQEFHCIFEDRDGNLWFGGDNGVSILSPVMNVVRSFTRRDDLVSDHVKALLESRDGRIWVGTDDRWLQVLGDPSKPLPQKPRNPRENMVSALYEGSDGRIYIGYWANSGFDVFNPSDGRTERWKVSGHTAPIQHCVYGDGDLSTSNWISDFLEDSRGRLWCVTWEGVGLNEFDRATGECLPPHWMSPFKIPTPERDSCIYLSNRLGSCVAETPSGDLVYGTTHAGLNLIDATTSLVTKYLHVLGDKTSLPDSYVTDIAVTPQGTVYAATRSGIYMLEGRTLLGGVTVNSVESDASGRIWAGTEDGLYFMDGDGSIGEVRKWLGFPSDIYGERVSCRLRDGSLAFGGNGGFAIFHPDSLIAAVGKPGIVVSELNQDGGRLSLAFSASDVAQCPHLLYRYRLDGEDLEWNQASYPHLNARYSGLAPGRYTLHVQCSDAFGRWIDGDEYTLKIRVPVPLLLRWPFILAYVLLLGSAVWLFVRLRERKLLHDKAELEKAVDIKTAALRNEVEARTRFFSLVSHDLKNPVHGVRTLAEQLSIQLDSLPKDELRQGVDLLRDSTDRTATMLDELLMWSVSQTGMLKPSMSTLSLSEIAAQALEGVMVRAEAKQVKMLSDVPEGLSVYSDRSMLITVLRNLLDNAVKFSYRGGSVSLSAGEVDGAVEISVRDSGPGMSAEVLDTLFEPGRKRSSKGTEGERGNGLGLLMSKELLGRLGATIQASNRPGGGSEFKITIKG